MFDEQLQIETKGKEILARMESNNKVSLFSKDYWYGSVMDWSMKNEAFKTQMFRFVDVLPALNSSQDVAQHLKEYFAQSNEDLPPVFNVGLGLGSLAPSLMAGAIRKNVTQMAKMFIAGENPKEALETLKKARKNRLCFTVDILGEATLSEKEALEYQARYLELIQGLAVESRNWTEIPILDRDHLGPIPKVNVSVKLTALASQINERAWSATKQNLKERLRPIFQMAQENNVFLNLDMEHYGVKDLTFEVFSELVQEPQFATYPFWGCVVQAYLRDSYSDLKKLVELAKVRGVPFTVRLVKGAYWDSETIEAQQKSWPVPVFVQKSESDSNYELCTKLLMQNFPSIRAAYGSHNVRSIAHALVIAEKLGVPKEGFEIQMLYGMADPIKKSLTDMGFRVREYAPLGELIPGMAYLVRRLLENTSNESWLRGKFADNKSAEVLLKDPNSNLPQAIAKPSTPHFVNESPLDFGMAENRTAMLQALQEVKSQLGQTIQPVINGKKIPGPSLFERKNPSYQDQLICKIQGADKALAAAAVEASKLSFLKWRNTPAEKRAQLLEALAEKMVSRKFLLMALQCYEVGKPWAEADGEVAEAIDFCRYYANQMRKLEKPLAVGNIPGEDSQYFYEPRGVSVVIAPWNFPLAILTGMTVAALVAGNTVIMKPAEQSTLIGWDLFQMMLDVGFPSDVIQFLPGIGEEVGPTLVSHPLVHNIAFTGSRSVGLRILESTSSLAPGQTHFKKTILELGGKNAIIVDQDADLDEAVDGVLHSAFGFAGQKCSACSRVIVMESVARRFEERLVEAAGSFPIRAAMDPECVMGPVVDAQAFQRIQSLITVGKQSYRLLFEGTAPKEGHFIPPVIFSEVPPDSSLAQDEIFGPILCILRAKDLDEALRIANGTQYALTGGLYSRSPANIQKVRQEFAVGNLYINRGITGAMVERHPFGGFKLSGMGGKAGGPDYLKHFMEPRCITENTLRRGFAPAATEPYKS